MAVRTEVGQDQASAPEAEVPLRETVRHCVLVFVGVRVGLGLLALLATALLPANGGVDVPGWPAPEPSSWSAAVTAWERWDALWYLRIADSGYEADDGSAAFFPLYPLLVRCVAFLMGGHPLPAALLVTNASALAALVVLARLTLDELGPEAARRTVTYLALFPTAFFFVAPYAEALFVLLALTALWAARRGLWGPAACAGALAAATRPAGVLLALPFAVEAVTRLRAAPARDAEAVRRALAGLAAAAAVPVGLLAYLGWWYLASGDALVPFGSQGGWQRVLSWPWAAIVAGVREGLRFPGTYAGGYASIDLVLVAFAAVAAVWVVRRTAATYSVYVVSALVLPLLLTFGGRPFMSLPRFVLPLFPLWWGLARAAERYGVHDAVVAVSAAGLGALTLLFVNWYFVF